MCIEFEAEAMYVCLKKPTPKHQMLLDFTKYSESSSRIFIQRYYRSTSQFQPLNGGESIVEHTLIEFNSGTPVRWSMPLGVSDWRS
jgi:hypothetical protein